MKPSFPLLAAAALLLTSFAAKAAPVFEYRVSTKGVVAPTCNLPWGGTINKKQKVTAFETASAPIGSTCSSEVRTCTGKNKLSGTFIEQSCVVGANQAAAGYLVFTVTAVTSGADNPNSMSLTSNGFNATCPGVVADGSTNPWFAANTDLRSYEAWGGVSATVCIPGNETDVKPVSVADTYVSFSNGWLKWAGIGAGITAAGKNWVLVGNNSTDTGGRYPSLVGRRFYAVQVDAFEPTINLGILIKGGTGQVRIDAFNYTVN